MDEAETHEIEKEVVSPQAEATQVNQHIESAPQEEEHPDWIKNLRRDRKVLRQQLEEGKKREKMQEELLQRLISQQQQSAPSQPQEEDIIQQIAREEYVPGEKVAKGLKKIEEKFDRQVQEIRREYASKHQNSLFNDLKREYSDFDSVVNPETLEILEETNPRLAQAIASNPDPYLMAVQSYEYIKAKGIHNSQTSKRVRETEAKIEQNKKTIRSPTAYESRPMATAFQMSEQMKEELRKEMYGNASRVGMGY